MVKALESHHQSLSNSNNLEIRVVTYYTIIKHFMLLHMKANILFYYSLQLLFGVVLSHQYLGFTYASSVLIDSYNYSFG